MQKILQKRTTTASKVPNISEIDVGEIVLNVNDGKMFIRKTNDDIIELGGASDIDNSDRTLSFRDETGAIFWGRA